MICLALLGAPRPGRAEPGPPLGPPRVAQIVNIFEDIGLHYSPDSAAKNSPGDVTIEDNGRGARTVRTLPDLKGPHRITAFVTVRPVAKSDREVFDRYDRAGSIRLVGDGSPDLEVARFITAYGGRTDFEIDVTALAPLLRGRRTFLATIDTWVSPAWRIDFSLRFTQVSEHDNATWAMPVYCTDSFNRERMPSGDSVTVVVPPGLARVVMMYFSTGHYTNGVDADEFISKANVVSIDGTVVARFHPWRDDCRDFRDRNPYCARWTDGRWSSDYSRSGWCPGVEVLPTEFDLTDHLVPGKHTARFAVEDMRPNDENGNFGYWRISAYLVGWSRPPALWRND